MPKPSCSCIPGNKYARRDSHERGDVGCEHFTGLMESPESPCHHSWEEMLQRGPNKGKCRLCLADHERFLRRQEKEIQRPSRFDRHDPVSPHPHPVFKNIRGEAFFVLDLEHDKFARHAILAYAEACEADFPLLAQDLRKLFPDA